MTGRNLEEEKEGEGQNKGYTRCRVLILVPYRRDAYQIIANLSEMFSKGEMKRVTNRQKFIDEFGDTEKELDDDFKLGISLMNRSIKLFSPFTNSDMIIASPMGLRLAMEKVDKEGQQIGSGFLSSVEMLVIEQANTIFF